MKCEASLVWVNFTEREMKWGGKLLNAIFTELCLSDVETFVTSMSERILMAKKLQFSKARAFYLADTKSTCVLCISTSFCVLRAPKSWLKYFFLRLDSNIESKSSNNTFLRRSQVSSVTYIYECSTCMVRYLKWLQ